jgi:hypothetical protein
MRKTTIYFFVALSLLSLGLTLVPQAFSQTQNIKIISYSYYLDNLGNLEVVGEVQNVGPNTVNPVILTGSVYSSDGVDQANSYPAQVFVSYLTPQQEAPFYMQFPQPQNSTDGTWDSLISAGDISTVTITVAQAKATSSYQYLDLKITTSSAAIATNGNYNGAYLVSGTIQNTGSQTATNITVVGAFFNSTGTVVGVGYTDYLTPATVAPSENVSFQISALDLNQTQVPSNEKITSYSLLVQTEGPILQGTPPIVTPYQVNGSPASTSSSPSSSPLSTPKSGSSNNSSNTVIIATILLVIVIIGAGAILILIKRRPNTVKQQKKQKTNTLARAAKNLCNLTCFKILGKATWTPLIPKKSALRDTDF